MTDPIRPPIEDELETGDEENETVPLNVTL